MIHEDPRPPVEDKLNCSYYFLHPLRIDNYNDITWQNQRPELNPDAARYCAGRKVNDTVSSLTNASNSWVVFAEHAGLGGRRFCAPPFTEVRDLRKFKGANDIFSSHETSTSPPGQCTWTSSEPSR